MKLYLSIVLLVLSVSFPGCSVPGSGTPPAIDDSVTLVARVDMPQIAAPGILPAIGSENNDSAFLALIASSSCKVNRVPVEFSISSTTRELKIEKMRPSPYYEIELRTGKLPLTAIVPHSGRNIRVEDGISLRSSAEWMLRKSVSTFEKLELEKLMGYSIEPSLVDSVAGFMVNSLKNKDLAWSDYDKNVDSAIEAVLKGKAFEDCLQLKASSFVFKGEYKGNVNYYVLNSAGTPELIVAAEATFIFNQLGNQINGSVKLVPTGVGLLMPKPKGPPGEVGFAFSGSVNGNFVRFVRKGPNNGSPLSGKDIDSWLIFPVSDGLAVRAENVDRAYFSGIQSRSGEFLLKR